MAAAQYILRCFDDPASIQVDRKADMTLVTSIDLGVQKLLIDRLQGQYPIVAEEDRSSHALLGREKSYLLIDPLDGTTSCKRFLNTIGGQIGYGPLVGLVENNRLVLSVFYNLPQRALFSAVRGGGTMMSEILPDASIPEFSKRQTLKIKPACALNESATLFYIGTKEELDIVHYLKKQGEVENFYRFGGFANDCTRLARGFEQIQVQFAVRPWDASATLLSYEAGFDFVMDPLGKKQRFEEYEMAMNNPLVSFHPALRPDIEQALKALFS